MLTTEIDPQCVLPVAQRFMSEEREIPTGTAVCFRETPFFIELMSHAGTLFGGIKNIPMFGKQVDPGCLFIFITAHRGSAGIDLAVYAVFTQQVSGEFKVIFLTPIADLLHKGVMEKIGSGIKIVQSHFGEKFAFHAVKQQRQIRNNGFSAACFVCFRQTIGPRHTGFMMEISAGISGFIGKDTGDHIAEIFAEFVLESLMCHADKFCHGIRIHRVEIGLTVEPRIACLFDQTVRAEFLFVCRHGFIFFDHAIGDHFIAVQFHGKTGNIQQIFRISILQLVFCLFSGFCKEQTPHTVTTVFRYDPASRTGGPAVFIVQPGLQTEFFTFFDRGAQGIHIFLFHVRRCQTHAGMEETPAHTHFVKYIHFPTHFFLFQFCVQGEKRCAALIHGGCGDLFQDRIQHD